MPKPERQRSELIGEVIIGMPRAGYPHEITKSNANRALTDWSLQHPDWRVFCETAYQLDDRNCLIPDLSVDSGRVVPGSSGVFQGAPEVAIEVVSSESASRLNDKIELYLSHHGKSVWVIYPKQRTIRIFDAGGGAARFREDQPLFDPNLPGFSVPTSAIFEGV